MNNNNEVKFDEWKPSQEQLSGKSKSGFGGKLANLIIKISGGLIKDERQANYVVLVLVLLVVILSIVIFFNALSSSESINEAKNLPPGFN
jgi:hypothetical protein